MASVWLLYILFIGFILTDFTNSEMEALMKESSVDMKPVNDGAVGDTEKLNLAGSKGEQCEKEPIEHEAQRIDHYSWKESHRGTDSDVLYVNVMAWYVYFVF